MADKNVDKNGLVETQEATPKVDSWVETNCERKKTEKRNSRNHKCLSYDREQGSFIIIFWGRHRQNQEGLALDPETVASITR